MRSEVKDFKMKGRRRQCLLVMGRAWTCSLRVSGSNPILPLNGRPLTFSKLLSQFPPLRPSSHHSKMGVLTLCGVTRIGNNMCIACGPEKVHDNLTHWQLNPSHKRWSPRYHHVLHSVALGTCFVMEAAWFTPPAEFLTKGFTWICAVCRSVNVFSQ